MEVNIEEIAPCKNRIQITIPGKKVSETYGKHFKDLKSSVRIKGFRPGKVPKTFLQRRYGTEVTKQVKLDLIEESLGQVMKENNLDPISDPDIDLGKILVEPDQDMTFEAVIEVRPTFELGTYKGIQVERPRVEVTEEDQEAEVLKLRQKRASLEPIEGDVIGDEDILFGTYTVMVGDQTAIQDENISIPPDAVTAGAIPVKNLRERAVEAGIGGTATLDVTLPRYYPGEEFRNKEGKLILSVQEGKKVVLPEANDEFARELDYDDMAELMEDLGESIKAHKETEADAAVETSIIDQIMESTPFSVPEGLVAKETEQITARLMVQMEFSGKEPEEIQKAVAESSEKQKSDVERRLKTTFLLDAIGKKEKIFITEEEVNQYIEAIASKDGKDPEEVRSYYEEKDLLTEIRYHLREKKIRNFLRENAEIS